MCVVENNLLVHLSVLICIIESSLYSLSALSCLSSAFSAVSCQVLCHGKDVSTPLESLFVDSSPFFPALFNPPQSNHTTETTDLRLSLV